MSPWPHDDTKSLISFYGDPGHKRGHLDTAWAHANLVIVKPPWRMVFGAKPVAGVQIHRKCAPSLERVFAAIWKHYGEEQKAIEAAGLHRFSGSFNFRPVRGSSRLSCHAFGAALDLDAGRNAMKTKGHMAQPAIDAFKAEGWFWGGDFRTRLDPMHFQAAHE